jgi:hypothetical protein
MRLSVPVHSWAKVASAVLCNFRLCAPLDRRQCAHARWNCLLRLPRRPQRHRRQHRHPYARDSRVLYRQHPNLVVVIELVCAQRVEWNASSKDQTVRLFAIPTAATPARLATVLPVVASIPKVVAAALFTYRAVRRQRPRPPQTLVLRRPFVKNRRVMEQRIYLAVQCLATARQPVASLIAFRRPGQFVECVIQRRPLKGTCVSVNHASAKSLTVWVHWLHATAWRHPRLLHYRRLNRSA